MLVGRGNLFHLDEAQDIDDQEWYAYADGFLDDFDVVEATSDERRRLIHAGFRIDKADVPIIVAD